MFVPDEKDRKSGGNDEKKKLCDSNGQRLSCLVHVWRGSQWIKDVLERVMMTYFEK